MRSCGAGLGALVLILAVAVIGKIVGGVARCASGRPTVAHVARGRLADERARTDGADRDQGRASTSASSASDLFTMLMVMAIVTTLMTGPLLTLFAGRKVEHPEGRAA